MGHPMRIRADLDQRYQVLHRVKQNLIACLRRSIEPPFDEKDLADAIEQMIDAKIAVALDHRY